MKNGWPVIPLGEVVRHRKQFVQIDDTQNYKRCRVQLHAQGVVLRDEAPGLMIKTKSQQVCRAGEFLVAEIDAKHGGYGIVPDELNGAIVSSHYFLFDVNVARLNRQFLAYFIKTPWFAEQVAAQGTTNYAAIRPGHVLAYKVPLPPIEEQRRIVACIDTLAAKIAEARALRHRSANAGDVFSPAMLGEFFVSISKECNVVALGDLTSCVTDGPHKTPHYVDDGVPFVTVKNMVTGRLDFRQLKYITHADHNEFSRRCRPERGDVLYSKDGATRGCPCFVDTDREFNIFVSVALIKPHRARLDGQYLVHLMNSKWIKDRMSAQSRGDMIPHIVLGEIKQFPVPLPSLAEQLRIVTHLDSLSAKAESLKSLQRKSADELEALLPSILDRAFKGEL